MMYLTYISQTYATRNNLEAKVLEHLKSFDRKLIRPEDIADFKLKVLARMAGCNDSFPKCNPVKISFSPPGEKGDIFMRWNDAVGFNGHETCVFTILASGRDPQNKSDTEHPKSQIL